MYPSPGVSEQFVKITLCFNCTLLKSTQGEASLVAPVYTESVCNAEDLGLILGQYDPLEKEMATTPLFLPGKSYGQRSLVGHSP